MSKIKCYKCKHKDLPVGHFPCNDCKKNQFFEPQIKSKKVDIKNIRKIKQ